MSTLPGVAEMRDRFTSARHSIFRLETRQTYRNSGEQEAIEAFHADKPQPHRPDVERYLANLRDRRRAGCRWQRVHVVMEPLSAYLEFELFFYATTVAAGEDVRLIPCTTAEEWPEQVPFGDFWLFDERERFDLSYDQDGTWHGAARTTTTDDLTQACRIRDSALELSIPWEQCMHQRYPYLVDRLPAGTTTH